MCASGAAPLLHCCPPLVSADASSSMEQKALVLTVGLERKDFGLVLGLLHFVCMKLFSRDDKEWGDMMLASRQEIYPQVERELEEENDEDGRQKLHSAKELLEPVWMYHIYETGKVAMMEE